MQATGSGATATAVRPGRRPGQSAPPPAPARRAGRFNVKAALIPWLFLAPALVIFAMFKFWPMAQAVKMSLYEVRPYLGDRWVGLDNYRQVFTDEDFLAAIGHTVVLAVGQTGGSIVLGMLLALLLEGSAKHLWVVRTAAFLPTVAAMAVVAEVWRILYFPAPDGAVNSIFDWFGVGPSQFLNSADSSLLSVMAVGVWRGAPYDMMIFLAGLAGVDRNLYEAAAVDGANVFRRIWHVTFPALRPVFAILFTLAAIRGLRVFTEIFLLTNGGPDGATEVMMTLIYKLGLERGELGIAAAGSMLLLAATVLLTVVVRAAQTRSSRQVS
ncbi:carbohydrate ABC transporter permease [Catellatospora vulcania]|uniref:carbohydrate ABC transporter permease n=1 Tax=Catellatospora vulcania TaxID=1460450 RepID=UPI0012D391AD|nr:sugar ABC transporter permease [Catellatospora vulcania]